MSWVMSHWRFPPHCTAPHVSTVQSHYDQLAWNAPRGGGPDGRVMRWTCDCDEVFYELIALGGLRFIRRIALQNRKTVIHESDRWSFSVANAMWTALLSGHAR
ncbi:hypothetical protein ACQP2T_10345 [Nonomuraea sp. CA-143628]|uniref:hypothetical protein n=1 Tax=Nonomuraea sp. CA-143628 TaxID=3239997 RepID=UPI003D8E7D21